MDRYWPRQFEEIEGSEVSLINEPLYAPAGTTALPVVNREKPLHAQLKADRKYLLCMLGDGS